VAELSGRTVNYGYDDLYRLTSETISGAASQNGNISYTYDSVGNRTQRNSTLPASPATGLLNYDANDRTSTDTYDANGNLLSSGAGANVYDFENRLVAAGGVKLVYDGDGNRVKETVAGTTTNYLVADQNLTGYAQVLDELQSGVVSRTYSYGLSLISQRLTANGQGLSFYGFDGHGSVRFLTSSTGAVTDTYDYDAFGNLITQTGTTPNNYLFAGEQFDPALGIYYNRARYYDQRIGRFWTTDAWEGDPQSPLSLHKYLYASANPINFLDPTGHDGVTPLTNIVLWLLHRGIYITTSLLGMNVHRLIQRDIQRQFPDAEFEVPVPPGGQIDVFIPLSQIFEIKPLGGSINPDDQLREYIDAAQSTSRFPYGLIRGTIYFQNTIDGPYGLTDIFYFTSRPGVIEYEVFPSVKLLVAAIAAVTLYNTASTFLNVGLATLEGVLSPVPI
jgi:RHS repeat-associated protein